ncbi:MAG: hypothetical protein WA373_03700 [Burkholderiales bacterium]
MATAASNSFNVGIGTAPTFSMPTVADELATYTLWGWTIDAAANPAYNSAPGYVVTSPDIHGDTESDDVWDYLQAYNRRTSGNVGYLQRAQAWRSYYVNNFETSPAFGTDAGFFYDHNYGWGLQQFGDQFNDAGAKAEALRICTTIHDFWAAGGRSGSGNWPVAGNFDIAHYGVRGPARNLHTAVAVADATGDAKAIELRDKLIDLWIQSPDYDSANGMYWVGDDQMTFFGGIVPPLSYAAGDRAMSSFHIGQLAEAFFAAWLSPNVNAQRKSDIKARILAMATWMLHNGLDPTYRYSSDTLGIRGSGGAWWNYSLNGPTTSWDGSYTISIVNLLVMAYKFTGDHNFLDATPANNLYPAKYCFNRGTKNQFGSTTLREGPGGSTVAGVVGGGAGNENIAYHFVDTRFDTSTGSQYLYNNKGELQYTYLIFENGGAPTVLP